LDLEHWRVDQDKSHDADDTRERLETLDDRLSDLESRLEQEEARREEDSESPEASASMGMRGMIPDARSFDSDGSFDMDAAAQTEAIVLATIAANAETGPRIDALESRISQLENASAPTHDRPWSVEVVLLPFGRQLPGIWFSAADSTRHSLRSQTCESWASQRGTPGLSFKSSGTGDTWTTESIEAWAHDTEDEWLSPKACGPTGTVFQRLVSRGLVRDIELRAPDAGHILQTISDAFDNVLPAEEHTTPELVAKFHGLRERYVPLRKIRKSSRLRFLSGAEMVTPATWTANFLEASVFMKANGDRRLYLTTPAGYIQAPSLGWTWPALRSLPMYDVDGELQAAQAVGDIVEACWSYNERLDHAASLHSSFASDDSPCWIISKGNCQVDDDDDADEDGRSSTAQQKWLRRSVSFPNSVSAQLVGPETQSKRRVTSFDVGPTSHDTEYSAECILKRRRLSSSPEIERRGFGLTPRYSREPPSPYPSADVGMVRSSQAASSRGRGTTPFAYATPHSHLEYRDNGDTDVDDSVPAIHSDAGDDAEEWEGMQDAPPSSPVVPKHGRRDNNVDAEEDIEDDYPDDDDEG
jgi:BMFP domain-containing protein YqiC